MTPGTGNEATQQLRRIRTEEKEVKITEDFRR